MKPLILLLQALFLLVGVLEAHSSVLYYDPSASTWSTSGTTGWSSTEGGSPADTYSQGWTNGNTASFNFGSGKNVDILDDLTLTGLSNSGKPFNLRAASGTVNLNLNNAVIEGGANSVVTLFSGVKVAGSFTINSGGMQFGAPTGGFYTGLGAMTVNGGRLIFGNSASTASYNVSVTSLQGTGGELTVNTVGGQSANRNSIFTVDQSTDTSFSGNIVGKATSGSISQFITLAKKGNGSLTLSGSVSGLATISGGHLYIDSTNTSFGDGTVGLDLSTTAIQVESGGVLGGNGTITTLEGDNVVVASGGKLAAGHEGTIGRTTYALGTGASLDISNISAGGIVFELGSGTTPGVTYDQIVLSSGSLNIGTLDFADFAFTAQTGFAAGDYTLFQTAGLQGSIGQAAGMIGGNQAILSIQGNDIILTVVPEPKVSAILGCGVFLLLITRFRGFSFR